MNAFLRRTILWLESLDEVTQVCMSLTVACFITAAALCLADCVIPVGSRSIGLVAVGCFYLAHAVAGLVKQQWRYRCWIAIQNRLSTPAGSLASQRVSQWEGQAAA
jgi:hypothetical protein